MSSGTHMHTHTHTSVLPVDPSRALVWHNADVIVVDHALRDADPEMVGSQGNGPSLHPMVGPCWALEVGRIWGGWGSWGPGRTVEVVLVVWGPEGDQVGVQGVPGTVGALVPCCLVDRAVWQWVAGPAPGGGSLKDQSGFTQGLEWGCRWDFHLDISQRFRLGRCFNQLLGS